MDPAHSPAQPPAPDAAQVARLLRAQAPHLAELPVRPSAASGSSNWVFRLGEGLAVRLPRSDDYAADLATETRWLPHLAPSLSVPVPAPVHRGEPSALFPRPWTVVTWVPGELPGALDAAQQERLAEDLGGFLRALHAADTLDEPAGPAHWGYRAGEPVTPEADAWVETAADQLADLFDPAQVRRAWQRLREVPPPTAAPCWLHTDLSAENLLVSAEGHLAGVIDFGGLGIGDPSADLLYAWSLLDAPARATLRRSAGADEATWLRARAWAFGGPGLLTLAHYRRSLPQRTARLTRMVEAVADEVGIALR